MATIAIDGLTKDFGDHRVVDGVAFDVPEGIVTGFLAGFASDLVITWGGG